MKKYFSYYALLYKVLIYLWNIFSYKQLKLQAISLLDEVKVIESNNFIFIIILFHLCLIQCEIKLVVSNLINKPQFLCLFSLIESNLKSYIYICNFIFLR